jgi:crotonobetainyl-CoA:carnitine CoA-transferase CaiB-like acyl-CoA transferase
MSGVLDGYRVIDCTQGLCGPFAALMLADAGAEVVKIEPPGGDAARSYGPPFLEGGVSAVFSALNRGKKSVVLDLESSTGKAALLQMLAAADVFLEDWGPGVADAKGCGYGDVSASNPGLVFCSITPFGPKGPFANRPGSELVAQAMATCCGTLGSHDAPPARLGVDVANMNTAAAATQGVLAALFHRVVAGRGQLVEVSMLGTLVHMRGLIWGAQSGPDAWHGWQCESYTRDPDYGWGTKDRSIYFNLRRGDEEDYHKLLIELGLEEHVTDPRFGEGGRQVTGHGQHAEETVHIWEQGFRDMTAEEACKIINRHNGEATPFNNHETLLAHPQMDALDMIGTFDDPAAGPMWAVLPPWRIAGVPRPDVGPVPHLGQHTDEVLGGAGSTNEGMASR